MMKTFEKVLRWCGLWSSAAVLELQVEHERTHDELRAAVDAAWEEADRERARRASAEDALHRAEEREKAGRLSEPQRTVLLNARLRTLGQVTV